MNIRYITSMLLAAILLLLSIYSAAEESLVLTPVADTNVNGLWWNPEEPGWGVSITQQQDVIFAVIFAFNQNGFSSWHVASNCEITNDACEGEVYEVIGGSEVMQDWNGDNKIVNPVGNVRFIFDSVNKVKMTLTIGDQQTEKSLVRQIFRSSPNQETLCLAEQRKADACIAVYDPVCATVNAQCVTTPCDPVKETFSNSCVACINESTVSYVDGECPL